MNPDDQQPVQLTQVLTPDTAPVPVQPLVESPVNPPTPPVVAKPRSKTVVTLAVVILIITALDVLGYWAYNKYTVKEPTAIAMPSATATAEPIENWGTFTSQNLNVSFRYPSFFRIIETISQPSPLGYSIFGEIDLKKFPTTLTNPTRKQISINSITKAEADYFLKIKVGETYTDPNLSQGFISLFDRLPNEIIGGFESYVYKEYAEEGVEFYPGKIFIIKKGDIYYVALRDLMSQKPARKIVTPCLIRNVIKLNTLKHIFLTAREKKGFNANKFFEETLEKLIKYA